MMPATRRHHVRAVLTLCLLAACSACRKETAEEVESTSPVSVRTEPAASGDIRGLIHATGMVGPAPGAELVVVAPEAARIVEIPKATGDRVRRGDVLVRFEIPGPEAAAQKLQAEVTRAAAALETTRAAQTRARELFDRGVAARKEVEDAGRSVADAEAAVAQARASLGAARTVADRSTVRATFDGVVSRRNHNPGDLVEPSSGDPVLRVIDPNRLEVIASVPLADVARVTVGASGRLVAPAGTSETVLKVLARPPAVESGTATAPVRLSLPASSPLPIGAPVQVDIDAEEHHDVVLVPAPALVREGQETAVFVAQDGKAKRRPVKVGLTDAEHVEIVSGVKAGDRVIVDGQAGLPDDAAIVEGEATETPGKPVEGQPEDTKEDVK
jgi:cobalt-zinc-cadmium efflux system membrane fusion protein